MHTDISFADFIDVDDALRRIGGNLDLYKRLLKRFFDGNDMESLENAFQVDNTEDIARLTHSIKGVSANLSLVKIRAIATTLEGLIRDGADHSADFAELKKVYAETAQKAKEFLG